MKKKFYRFTKLILIFLLVFNLFPDSKKANVVPFLKVAAGSEGSRIVAGIAEKAGVKFTSKTAREKAVEKWNLEVYQKIEQFKDLGKHYEALELERFQKQIATMKPTPIGESKPGWSKAILSTAAFLIGADIIYDIYSEHKLAEEQKSMMEVMGDYNRGLSNGEYFESYGNLSTYMDFDAVNEKYGEYAAHLKVFINTWGLSPTVYGLVDTSKPYIAYFKVDDRGWIIIFRDYYNYTSGNHYQQETSIGWPITDSFINNVDKDNDFFKKLVPVDHGSVDPLPSTINPILDPLRNPGIDSISETSPIEIPSSIPKEVEIIVPTANDYPEVVETPWNDPVTEWDPTPKPDPGTDPTDPTTPGDGDGGDSKPPSIWKPWLFLLPFLEFLIACINFVIKLGTFLVTIPRIPPEPLPGTFGQMFTTLRNYNFNGFYPYNVMITLATTLFGFTIYKILRRVFNG